MTWHTDLPSMKPLSKLARELGVHVSTCHRWRTKGISHIKLRCRKIGGRWYVHEKEVEDFVAATTASTDGREAPRVAPTAKAKPNAAEDAGRQLDAFVFGGRQRRRRQRKQGRDSDYSESCI